MLPDSIVYFYIEDSAQMNSIYDVWNGGEGEIQLQIYLRDFERPQLVVGIPKPEIPPYENPPYHLKLQFTTDALRLPLQDV